MPTPDLAFLRRDADGFVPLDMACSLWSSDQMHGVAVSGLLAEALESAVAARGRTDLVPARYHVDLFRAARMRRTTTSATVVREGPRLVLVDAELRQDGDLVARASCTFLTPSQVPAGKVWQAEERATPPPLDVAPATSEVRVPFFASEAPWSDDFSSHQNAGRHATWQVAVPTLLGEPMTPFQAVASIADATSMVTNWGSAGIEYINTDISLALARGPVGVEVGLRALDHVARDGVAAGTAEVFDRHGTLGTATVTSLANTRRTVDLATRGRERTSGSGTA